MRQGDSSESLRRESHSGTSVHPLDAITAGSSRAFHCLKCCFMDVEVQVSKLGKNNRFYTLSNLFDFEFGQAIVYIKYPWRDQTSLIMMSPKSVSMISQPCRVNALISQDIWLVRPFYRYGGHFEFYCFK